MIEVKVQTSCDPSKFRFG